MQYTSRTRETNKQKKNRNTPVHTKNTIKSFISPIWVQELPNPLINSTLPWCFNYLCTSCKKYIFSRSLVLHKWQELGSIEGESESPCMSAPLLQMGGADYVLLRYPYWSCTMTLFRKSKVSCLCAATTAAIIFGLWFVETKCHLYW